jgi:hypothetical protein
MNFATSKNLIIKSTVFPYCNIHKYSYTWNSPNGKKHNQTDYVLIDKRRHSSIVDVRSIRGADSDTIMWWMQKLQAGSKWMSSTEVFYGHV